MQLCHMNGGPGRTDYSYVANYLCQDGSKPLRGAEQAGADARVGNVGAGPDGHIVDLYRVPCPNGVVDLYVDAYHCGPHVDVNRGMDIDHLSAEELATLADMVRGAHEDPSSVKATQRRKAIAEVFLQSKQIHLELCPGIAELLPTTADPNYLGELLLSMGASVIEDGRPAADPVSVYVDTLAGVLVFYSAVLAEAGESAREPLLDSLLEKAKDREGFPQFVRGALGDCGNKSLGVDPP